jgi:hypothetical protein
MKKIYAVLAIIFLANVGYAQDTTRTQQPHHPDTIIVERVRVDTVYLPSSGQESKETQQSGQAKNDKVYFGGYANLSFGKYTVIGFEPLIAYKLFPRFSIGGKFSYQYAKNKNYSPAREGSNYGISVFTRLRIARRFYAHVEFSEMNYKIYDALGEDSRREWISFLYIGGGFSQPISKRTSLNAEVLWDVLQDDDSPYKTVEPFFNVGIVVGF